MKIRRLERLEGERPVPLEIETKVNFTHSAHEDLMDFISPADLVVDTAFLFPLTLRGYYRAAFAARSALAFATISLISFSKVGP